jgi:hypothetical protein
MLQMLKPILVKRDKNLMKKLKIKFMREKNYRDFSIKKHRKEQKQKEKLQRSAKNKKKKKD